MNRKKDELSYLKFTLSTRSRFGLVAESLLTIPDPGFRQQLPCHCHAGSKCHNIYEARVTSVSRTSSDLGSGLRLWRDPSSFGHVVSGA